MIYKIISKLPDLKKTKINTATLTDFRDKKIVDVICLAGLLVSRPFMKGLPIFGWRPGFVVCIEGGVVFNP